jgi:hypothetical protein
MRWRQCDEKLGPVVTLHTPWPLLSPFRFRLSYDVV